MAELLHLACFGVKLPESPTLRLACTLHLAERRVVANLIRQIVRELFQLLGGHEVIENAQLQCALGWDRLRGKEHFLGDAQPDDVDRGEHDDDDRRPDRRRLRAERKELRDVVAEHERQQRDEPERERPEHEGADGRGAELGFHGDGFTVCF